MTDGTEITPQIDIRERYELFASLRPCKLIAGVPTRLRATAIDVLVIRETTERLFAGRHNPRVEADRVSDTLTCIRRFEGLRSLLLLEQPIQHPPHSNRSDV